MKELGTCIYYHSQCIAEFKCIFQGRKDPDLCTKFGRIPNKMMFLDKLNKKEKEYKRGHHFKFNY
jgi:hypothetical protein